jgi:hypothetical protein
VGLEKNDKIVWVEIDKLKPHEKNSNTHPKDQIERLAKILKYQGFRSPIQVSNLSGCIVAGHGRLEAAKLNGLTKVPVSYQDFDSVEQEIAHLNADNAIALWAEIDMTAVEESIKDFSVDFDTDFLGFENFHFKDQVEKTKKEKEKSFNIEVECESEKEQKEIYEFLLSEGIIAKVK